MIDEHHKSEATKADNTQVTPVESDWIAAARMLLIEGGVAAVQINPLATRLGVTRGGFYWRFKNRQDLLDNLIADWQNGNNRAFRMALARAGTPQERYRRLVRMLVEEKDFSPALDTAVRQWGAVDPGVGTIVERADSERVEGLAQVFRDAGQPEDEARVRARIVYYHQVGYYALGIRESRVERRRLMAIYDRILTGFDEG